MPTQKDLQNLLDSAERERKEYVENGGEDTTYIDGRISGIKDALAAVRVEECPAVFFESRGYVRQSFGPGGDAWWKLNPKDTLRNITICGTGDYENAIPPESGPFRVSLWMNDGEGEPPTVEVVVSQPIASKGKWNEKTLSVLSSVLEQMEKIW